MRLTQKKINEIILGVLGEAGAPLLKELTGRENVSEFDLATKTKKDIKIVRKMLYLLYNHNLIGFTRKKDKIKGWYVYYWTLLPENIKFNYIKRRQEALLLLKSRLEEESKESFFACPKNCVRLNFDHAMDFEFHCPECGDLLRPDSGEEKLTELKKKIKEIEEELKKAVAVVKTKSREHKKVVKRKIAAKKKATPRKKSKKK